jgi:hypothetical protein
MARILILVLAVLVLIGGLAADALAQPKVTITGFIDTVTSWSKNLRDLDFDDARDEEWYARSRVRPDIIAEVGKAKLVLGFELDHTFGTTDPGGSDGSFGAGSQRAGTRGAFDLNTDVAGTMELKWAYIEFPMPWNIPTVVRIGAQPFATTYKLGVLASGDFAGVNLETTFTPNVKWHITYAMIEENLTGSRFGFGRADDSAIITSLEITPIKGLDIRPIYSYFHADGTTSGAAVNRPAGFAAGGVIRATDTEERHTVGVDARWRKGPFSLDPTFLYQWGGREMITGAGVKTEADISAWLVDVIGGWRKGPLLVELRGVYTTGNKSTDDLSKDVEYYQVINTDTGYFAAGWGEIFPLGIDYFNGAFHTLGTGIGLDRYGRMQAAARATYSFTPDFDIRGVVSAGWTEEKVDTDTPGGFLTPGGTGDARFMGIELNLGLTWRFAPGLAFDAVYAYLLTDPFGKSSGSFAPALKDSTGDVKDVQTMVARIRFSF